MYYQSFTPDQVEEYVAHFNEHGFVVVDNVLSEEQLEKSKEEIWEYITEKSEGKFLREDPTTWGDENWPKEICRNGGFMGRFPYIKRLKLPSTLIPKQHTAWENRQNPLVYEVFKNCMGTKRLWVSIDRYGILRPTKLEIGGETIAREEWMTKKDWVHWDLSPFHNATSAAGFAPADNLKELSHLEQEYGGLRVQGLITIEDNPEERGGFHCVPGFHGERFFQWAEDHRDTYGSDPDVYHRNFVEVPEDDPMRSEVIKIPMRAGSIIVWNSQLPHGNYPNTSDEFRMVQYIKMIDVDEPREFKPAFLHDKFEPDDWLGGFELSELGKKLLGIEEWSDEE
eukprot:TRINITY_DN13517_c0_g1_i1.p1 TRINITY_DN13517_c0_g1~~TRINITY_DN13517_c0_g1_i1.p1  ORF type:complete len:339 (+),score=105.34 TRINITY_DN13517_c0_g1_i1:55-1071(+)